MSNGHNGTVFRVLYPKISTGQEKLAPTGRHGRHVFATLLRTPVHYVPVYQVLVPLTGFSLGLEDVEEVVILPVQVPAHVDHAAQVDLICGICYF